MGKRHRRIGSVREELLKKSREAALAAVQIFNNPQIMFKSEIYVVLMQIAWTYLLHAYFRSIRIDYRYFEAVNGRRKFERTRHGAKKYWGLDRCLDDPACPIEKDVANNLRFLMLLRHEIEHRMTTRIDDHLSARFQASCLNYNQYITKLFGPKYSIDKYLSFSLQLSSITEAQLELIPDDGSLPSHLRKAIMGFDARLSEEEFNSPHYAYRVLFVAKTANRRGQADKVIEFVKSDSTVATEANKQYVVIKDGEKTKFRPGDIVKKMHDIGYARFNMHHHTVLWKSQNAKETGKGFGVDVAGTWYWYESWVKEVEAHCFASKGSYQ